MFRMVSAKSTKISILGGLALFFCLIPAVSFPAGAQSPSIGKLAISPNPCQINEDVVITSTYIDPDGWKDLKHIHLVVGDSPNPKNAIFVYYNPKTKRLYLRDEANAKWLGGYYPGVMTDNNEDIFIQNSFGGINCTRTTIEESGSDITVSWVLNFKNSYAGVKNIYPFARNDSGRDTGWGEKQEICIFRRPIPPLDD